MTMKTLHAISKGTFFNYVDKILAFFNTYPLDPLTFSSLSELTKSQHFWTTYPPLLVNVVCERPKTLESREEKKTRQ